LGEHEHELERSWTFMNVHEQCSRMTFWMSGIVNASKTRKKI
jgi:hypothetical protein